jgi:hypothetical protein
LVCCFITFIALVLEEEEFDEDDADLDDEGSTFFFMGLGVLGSGLDFMS